MGRTSVRLRNALCVIGLLTVTAACGSIDRFTGYLPSEAEVESLQVGISTKEDAIAVFGPPLADRALENNTIYYAASQIRTLGPFAPRIVDRQVLAVAFDSDDVLRNISRYTLDDGRVVVLDRRVTEDGINDVSFLGQLFASFGRLDAGALLGQ